MNLLVFNAGSSSLNYKLYRTGPAGLELLARGKAHRVGVHGTEAAFIEHHSPGGSARQEAELHNHEEAARLILAYLREQELAVDAVGHRFVHGGEIFQGTTRIDAETLPRLRECLPLAPIHNPNSMMVIELCLAELPGAVQYAAFDTAFHASLPAEATRYAIPDWLVERFGFRKYGFHGLSYRYLSQVVPEYLQADPAGLRLVACHLGTGGSSTCAIRGGRSVETSMGFSPLAGLVMSTRPGDLDPEIPLVMDRAGLSPGVMRDTLNQQSGLLALSGGYSSDLRDIILAAEAGDERCTLAFGVYVHRLKLWIGSMAAALGGLDALVFTDDLGVQSWQLRQAVCESLGYLGVQLDPSANQSAPFDRTASLHAPGSIPVLSVPADEEYVIALEGMPLLKTASPRGL